MNKKGMSFEATFTIDKEVMSSLAKYLKETDDEILDGLFSGEQMLILHNSKRGTAELIRVVRCKDCKYWNGELCKKHSSPIVGALYGTDANDYCSCGERKDDETI